MALCRSSGLSPRSFTASRDVQPQMSLRTSPRTRRLCWVSFSLHGAQTRILLLRSFCDFQLQMNKRKCCAKGSGLLFFCRPPQMKRLVLSSPLTHNLIYLSEVGQGMSALLLFTFLVYQSWHFDLWKHFLKLCFRGWPLLEDCDLGPPAGPGLPAPDRHPPSLLVGPPGRISNVRKWSVYSHCKLILICYGLETESMFLECI